MVCAKKQTNKQTNTMSWCNTKSDGAGKAVFLDDTTWSIPSSTNNTLIIQTEHLHHLLPLKCHCQTASKLLHAKPASLVTLQVTQLQNQISCIYFCSSALLTSIVMHVMWQEQKSTHSGMNGGKGFWGRRGHCMCACSCICRKRAALTKSHSALGNPLN